VAGLAASVWWHVALHAAPGLSSMGGVAGALAAIAVVAPPLGLPRRALLDAIAPAALVGFAIGRLGCFCAGCCYGTPTTLAWGVVIDALGPPARHPVQLVEAALDLVAAVWAARGCGRGVASGRAMLGYAVVRLAVEPLRDPVSADVVGRVVPSAVYWCATALALAGVCLLGWRDGARRRVAALAPR
jgi:phosphatidylglycerol:prolipoprotein diacylglycerol transferase